MKNIANVSFHAAYNYGSNLQAYALQKTVEKLGKGEISYKIINLRKPNQKQKYAVYRKKINSVNIFRNLLTIPYSRQIQNKNEKFEKFITEKLNITKEYSSLEELKNEDFNYDYYISGSDQLWNLNAQDFDWTYYLDFVKKGKKISYAASFGPKEIKCSEEDKKKVGELLKEYSHISVREQGSFDNVSNMAGIEPEIHVDPTMLLDPEEWEECISKDRVYEGKYIFFYTLSPDKEMIKIVKEVSKKLNLPVVITKFNNQHDYFSNFIKKYETGPSEFLNLVKNAELVLSSSFHGTLFPIIFNKPFFSIRGLKDFRIRTTLEVMGLEDRSIDISNVEQKCDEAFKINFDKANAALQKERTRSTNYLKKALDLN